MTQYKKNNFKEIQNLLDTDNALSIFQDLLGESPKNNRVVRLFDDTKNASEMFGEAKGKYPAHIYNYSTGEYYTAVNAYMRAYSLEWKKAVIELGKQYGHLPHDYDSTPYEKRTYTPKAQPTEQERREVSRLANPTFGVWSEAHLAYWKTWHITQPLLEQYGVKPLQSFDLIHIETGEHKCTIPIKELAYGYELGEAVKKYQPKSKKYKWQWIGENTKSNILWGLEQLPEKCVKIVIVEGLKDALAVVANFSEFGIYAVGLDSAGQKINANDLEALKSKVSNPNDVFLCLDNDKTGKEQNKAKAQKYGLSYLPYKDILVGKDLADLVDSYAKFVIKEWLLSGERVGLPMQEAKEQEKTALKGYDAEKVYDIRNGDIVINNLKLLRKLYDLGFRRFDLEGQKESIFVHIQDNIVRETILTEIEDCFFQWLEKNHVDEYSAKLDELKNKLYKGLPSYFSERMMNRLGTQFNLHFIKDTKNKAFFYFQNGIVEVTAEAIQLVPYSQMQGHIWENQILQREFHLSPENEYEKCYFAQFCDLIAKKDVFNMDCLKSIIGYLLHDFKENKRKAVNFTDSSLERGNNGRTGKTLLAKAIGLLRVYGEINGKNFDVGNKHKYQDLKLDSQFVNLNDVKKGFKLEWIYNDITEGLMVEKKNQTPFRIRPNLLVCSNLPLELEGGSDKDRVLEFEFDNFFSPAYSPEDHFKHWFFRDWDAQEWNKFDSFMLSSVQFYLKVGQMLQPANTNLAQRKLREFTSHEFLEFIEAKEIKTDLEYEKNTLLSEFVDIYPDFEGMKVNKLTKWLRIYAENTPTISKIQERQNAVKKNVFIFHAKTPPNAS